MKNYLFSVVDETRPHVSEIEELERIWGKIVGKLGEQKVEDYLRYYWNSANRSTSKKLLFKTIKASVKTKEQVFSLIRDLNDNADLYLAVQDPEDEFWKDKPETKVSLKALKLFQIKQTNSLFLAGLKHLNAEQFRQLSRICAVISFRYNVVGGLNPNAQEDIYNDIALKIEANKKFDVKDFQPVYVSDSSFENDFAAKEFRNTTRNHKIVKYLLAKIEQHWYGNEIDPESDLFSVEHILPENADETWGGFSYEDINRSIYRIGNLTLLEKKWNREAGQQPYEAKKSIFAHSQSRLTNSIPEHYHTWDMDKIASRQRALAKQAKSVWKVQELS